MSFLTIAIPTYNRAAKIDRLLGVLVQQIHDDHLEGMIDVAVSDNASTDDIEEVVSRHLDAGMSIGYFRQSSNMGFDGNLMSLYCRAKSRFIWWMGSDDIPLAGSMKLVLGILKSEDPDMITGSFRQPGTGKTFNFAEPVVVVRDPRQCIEYLCMQPKISSQVLRRIDLQDAELAHLRDECGNGWMHFALAFTVLGCSATPRVALVSEYMATSDEDYNLLEWTPIWYLYTHKTMHHPFVAKTCPELAEKVRREGYLSAIGLCFAVKTGKFRAQSEADYDKFIGDLEWRPGELLRHPGTLIRFAAVKSGTAGYFGPLTRKLMPWLRRVKSHATAFPASR